jgi:quinol monooxygenase YgiN
MADESGRIVVRCIFKIDPEFDEEYVRTSRENWELSLEHAGCIEYTYARDLFDPTIAYAYQEWESQEAFEAHSAHPDHQGRMGDVEDYVADGRIKREKIHIYTVDTTVDVLNR